MFRLLPLARRSAFQIINSTSNRCLTRLAIASSSSQLSVVGKKQHQQHQLINSSKHLFNVSIRQFASVGAEKPNADGIIHFNLADVGEGITECEVIKWYVKEGDKVQEFDKLCELQSDKATVEITSRYNGQITKIFYQVSEKAKVGHPLVDIRLDSIPGAPTPAAEPKHTPAKPAQSQQQEQKQQSSHEDHEHHNQEYQSIDSKSGSIKILATPAVRMMARQNQIDLRQINGSGREGRVLKQDVINFLENGKPTTTSASASTTASSQPIQAPIVERPTAADREVPLSRLQKAMTKTMNAAAQVPHFGYCDEIQVDGLIKLRSELKSFFAKRDVKLTYMPIILKATSLALQQYPMLNSHVNSDCTAMIYKARHNIGIAMDTPEGLVVPVVKDIQDRSIIEVAIEINRLQKLGAAGKLAVSDMNEGTFTLSNIGAIGGTYASPVLFLPQVAIGALGKFQTLPRFDSSGNVQAATIMNVSWSADHRVIDGATMARFSNLWRDYLEDPAKMLASLR